MADIPLEPTRKKQPLWLWLLLGLGALLLLLLLIRGCGGDVEDTGEVSTAGPVYGPEDGVDDGIADVDGAPLDGAAPAGSVTTFDDLFAGDGTALVGRRVDIDRARVVAVPGDSTFIVAPEGDDSRQVVVVLDDVGESQTGAGGSDGRYNVDVGDVVGLVGTAEAYRAGAAGTSALDAGQRQELGDRGFYVRTRQLDIQEAASGAN